MILWEYSFWDYIVEVSETVYVVSETIYVGDTTLSDHPCLRGDSLQEPLSTKLHNRELPQTQDMNVLQNY